MKAEKTYFALAETNLGAIVTGMTATQVIKEIETLAPVERREVFAFVHNLEAHAAREHKAPAFMDHESFKQAADAVFGMHGDLLQKLAQ